MYTLPFRFALRRFSPWLGRRGLAFTADYVFGKEKNLEFTREAYVFFLSPSLCHKFVYELCSKCLGFSNPVKKKKPGAYTHEHKGWQDTLEKRVVEGFPDEFQMIFLCRPSSFEISWAHTVGIRREKVFFLYTLLWHQHIYIYIPDWWRQMSRCCAGAVYALYTIKKTVLCWLLPPKVKCY